MTAAEASWVAIIFDSCLVFVLFMGREFLGG